MAKKRKISDEEKHFTAWLVDAKKYDLVGDWEEQPETFDLIPKAEIQTLGMKKPKFLLHPHTYTTDFRVPLTAKGQDMLRDAFAPAYLTPQWQEDGILFVDTKGGFTVQSAQIQIFQANRKLLWHFHKVWITKVVPWISPVDRQGLPKPKAKPCLFTQTYCPSSLAYNNNLTLTSKARHCRTIEHFIEDQQTLLT